MAYNLESVEGYVKGARALLLDKVVPYRYSDVAMVVGLNLALQEGRRIRPDLFICRYGVDVPQYEGVSGEIVPVEGQFRNAFLFGIAAQVLLRDEEDVQDARSNNFRDMFESILLGVRQAPMHGGTPTAQAGNQGAP